MKTKKSQRISVHCKYVSVLTGWFSLLKHAPGKRISNNTGICRRGNPLILHIKVCLGLSGCTNTDFWEEKKKTLVYEGALQNQISSDGAGKYETSLTDMGSGIRKRSNPILISAWRKGLTLESRVDCGWCQCYVLMRKTNKWDYENTMQYIWFDFGRFHQSTSESNRVNVGATVQCTWWIICICSR